MDINEYAMETLVRERLSTLRAAARQHALSAPRASGPGLRVRLGTALVRAGEWLRAGAEDPAPSHSTHG
jgi:hypothetical protein